MNGLLPIIQMVANLKTENISQLKDTNMDIFNSHNIGDDNGKKMFKSFIVLKKSVSKFNDYMEVRNINCCCD